MIYVKSGFDYKTNFIDRLNLTNVEMFKLDKQLKGPNGTSYTGDNDRWGSRARIDEDGAAGYFTEK